MASRGTKRKIRYAVVGLGHIAQVAVLPAFKHAQNSELVALVSDDASKRKKLGKKYRISKTYSYDEYEKCLSDDVDAVYIALPNALHKDYSVRAAMAGVHVLSEKPLAVSQAECVEIIRAAEENKVKLMVAYRLHFEEGNLKAVALAKSGKLGDLRIFSSDFTQQVVEGNIRLTYPLQEGGGSVYDMGVYCINAARYLFRDEPFEVFAYSASRPEERFRKADEMTSVLMRFPGERLATFTCSFGAAPLTRYTLIGTKGSLTADNAYEYSEGSIHQLVINEKKSQRKFPKRDQFAAELVYFSDCILKNQEPEPSGIEGLIDVRIIEAIYESARKGKPVRIEPIDKRRRPTIKQEIHRPAVQPPETVKAESPSGEAA